MTSNKSLLSSMQSLSNTESEKFFPRVGGQNLRLGAAHRLADAAESNRHVAPSRSQLS